MLGLAWKRNSLANVWAISFACPQAKWTVNPVSKSNRLLQLNNSQVKMAGTMVKIEKQLQWLLSRILMDKGQKSTKRIHKMNIDCVNFRKAYKEPG